MLETERQLADMAEHMLLGVATKFGKRNLEYGLAGGVPKNQRRKGLRGESPTSSSQNRKMQKSALAKCLHLLILGTLGVVLLAEDKLQVTQLLDERSDADCECKVVHSCDWDC